MSAQALRSVLELLPTAFHRVGASGDIIHGAIGLGSGMRGLLLSLDHFGPMTVSKLAAMRPVSRQFVQRVMDELVAGGWVEAIPNPQHKRSPLMQLTQKGRAAVGTMLETEQPYVAALTEGIDGEDIAATIRVLSAICHKISPELLDQLADGVDPVRALAVVNA
jgi:DNA-binding MarR family transcriptional regulator